VHELPAHPLPRGRGRRPLSPPKRDAEGPGPRLILRTDGAARGNPGPSSAGVVVEDAHGRALVRKGVLLGRGTNNEAEYRALIAALEEAKVLGAREVEARADSQLMVMQITGHYRVKAANLKPLYAKVRGLLASFERWRVVHVPREENREADRLANRALDGYSDIRE
jgi:ribonuclease HI